MLPVAGPAGRCCTEGVGSEAAVDNSVEAEGAERSELRVCDRLTRLGGCCGGWSAGGAKAEGEVALGAGVGVEVVDVGGDRLCERF